MRFENGYRDGRGGGRPGGRDGLGGNPGRGGPRRRLFDGGQLRLVLLRLIEESPRHGYDLIRALEELTGGGYAPSPGVIYPTLTMLGDMGLIEEKPGEGTRKAFAITDAGRAHLAGDKDAVDTLFARIAEVGARHRRFDGAAIRRAMGNLRAVLEHRLGREDADANLLLSAAGLIDDAAQKIERL